MTGTIQQRDTFLSKIANQLGREKVATNVVRPQWRHQPQDAVLRGASQDDLVDVLEKQCTTINTDFVVTRKDSIYQKSCIRRFPITAVVLLLHGKMTDLTSSDSQRF